MLKLLERRPGDSITSGRSQKPGQPLLPQVVQPGASVTLRDSNKVDIYVRVTDVKDGNLTGVIEQFAGHDGPAYGGHHLGDTISFKEANVFVCIL